MIDLSATPPVGVPLALWHLHHATSVGDHVDVRFPPEVCPADLLVGAAERPGHIDVVLRIGMLGHDLPHGVVDLTRPRIDLEPLPQRAPADGGARVNRHTRRRSGPVARLVVDDLLPERVVERPRAQRLAGLGLAELR